MTFSAKTHQALRANLQEVQMNWRAAFAPPPRPHSEAVKAELAQSRCFDWAGIDRLMGPGYSEKLRAAYRPPIRFRAHTYTTIAGTLLTDPEGDSTVINMGGIIRQCVTVMLRIEGGEYHGAEIEIISTIM